MGKRIHPLNEDYFKEINSENKAYWLGFLAADGCVTNRTVCIGLKKSDFSHLEIFRNDIGSDVPIEIIDKRNRTIITLCSKKLVKSLEIHNVTKNKSFTLKPWNGPKELLRHYWRGLFDGDGCISKFNTGYWTVGLVGTYDVVDGFCRFVEYKTGIKKYPDKHSSIFKAYYTGISYPQAVAKLLYDEATVSLIRKKDRIDELLKIIPKRKKLR